MAKFRLQIYPHYFDPTPGSAYQGETREERLTQFLEENDVPVLAMHEGTWLRVDGGTMRLSGAEAGARFFCPRSNRSKPTAATT